MSKVFEVHYCSECPHRGVSRCYHLVPPKNIDTYPRIPEWCPLEDKKEESPVCSDDTRNKMLYKIERFDENGNQYFTEELQ